MKHQSKTIFKSTQKQYICVYTQLCRLSWSRPWKKLSKYQTKNRCQDQSQLSRL